MFIKLAKQAKIISKFILHINLYPLGKVTIEDVITLTQVQLAGQASGYVIARGKQNNKKTKVSNVRGDWFGIYQNN